MRVSKVMSVLYYAALILLLVWFTASYIDVVIDNHLPNPVHYEWNAFLVMKGWVK